MKLRQSMTRGRGVTDDEWYTPRKTADELADWLKREARLASDTPILCPADILPDGTESAIPQALRASGFTRVRVTRDLPLDPLFADRNDGEIIVTNPPFSILVPLREWLRFSGARYCMLSRPGALRGWTVPKMKDRFYSTDGRRVAANWMQNLVDTSSTPPDHLAIGDCALCERRSCPRNGITDDWSPGRPRRLFGFSRAVKYGISGNWCSAYTVSGKQSFLRFFKVKKSDSSYHV